MEYAPGEAEEQAYLGVVEEPVYPVVVEEADADVEERKGEGAVVYHETSVEADWNTNHHHHHLMALHVVKVLVEASLAWKGVVHDFAAEVVDSEAGALLLEAEEQHAGEKCTDRDHSPHPLLAVPEMEET
jgi:hypothetical protein